MTRAAGKKPDPDPIVEAVVEAVPLPVNAEIVRYLWTFRDRMGVTGTTWPFEDEQQARADDPRLKKYGHEVEAVAFHRVTFPPL